MVVLADEKVEVVVVEEEVAQPVSSQSSCSCRAMSSSSSREQFLRQMEQIVEGIKQNRIKVAATKDSLLKTAL